METPGNTVFQACQSLVTKLQQEYWQPMRKHLEKFPSLMKTVPGYLVQPEKVILYLGHKHWGIEYQGPDKLDELKPFDEFEYSFLDLRSINQNFLSQIIGHQEFDLAGSNFFNIEKWKFYLSPEVESRLNELGFDQFDKKSIDITRKAISIPNEKIFRLSHTFFIYPTSKQTLSVRNFMRLDIIPHHSDQFIPLNNLSFLRDTIEEDCRINPLMTLVEEEKELGLERFRDLIGQIKITEPEITNFLALPKYQYLLKLGFHASGVFHQLKCKWPDKRKSMKPDFFLLDNRGMGHIVEFNISHATFFPNWQTTDPQSMIDQVKAYVNHTRKFRQYFDDPNNRSWFQKKYGIPIMNPRRILVIGRRREFSTGQWIDIKSHIRDLEIVNYDELMDHVLAHLVLDNVR